jgi:type I restriction enzyme S subunit
MMSKRVPKLRFKEFESDGEWEEKRLGDIGKISMCKRILKHQTSEIGDIPFFKIGTFGKEPDAYITKELYEEFKTKYSYPKKGDILISASGTIGRLVIFDGSSAYFQDSNIVWIDNNDKLVKNSFLFYIYQNIKWTTDDNTIPRLYNDNLRNMEIIIPKNPQEQQKIANTLSSLDNLIISEDKKLQALQTYKKGLMQQLFPKEGERVPKLRFKEFKSNGEWEEKRLGEVGNFYKGKGISKNDISNNGIECIRYGELYTVYTEIIKNIYSKTNLDKRNLVLSKKNDVIIPSSGETQEDIATASCVLKDNIALGGDLNIIRTKINGSFLAYYLNGNKQRDIARLSQGVSVIHLYNNQLKNLKILIPPTPQEQKKIANTLSSLDNLIEEQSKKIETLKEHKKGLMQQMFVSEDS